MVKNKYSITRDYVTSPKSRTNEQGAKRRFLVAHDTGNPGSTARGNANYMDNRNKPSSSAHTFIDDEIILEIIPLNEKAWHVMYNRPEDNALFGDDANDASIGTELCYGGKINFSKAYDRYVWYHAYLCKKYGLNPLKHIVGHYKLDPARRTDPINAFSKNGKTWAGFLADVLAYYNAWEGGDSPAADNDSFGTSYIVEKGDTLYSIGRKFNVSVDNLKAWNGLKSNTIHPGDKLKLTQAIDLSKLYTVKSGDTLSEIALAHKMSLAELKALNGLTSDLIHPGDKLRVSGKTAPVITSPRFDLPTGVYKTGSRGDAVEEIQKALVALNFYPDKSKANGGVDGDYGNKTKDAVRRFQSVYLPYEVDGVYGNNTRSKMIEQLKKRGLY